MRGSPQSVCAHAEIKQIERGQNVRLHKMCVSKQKNRATVRYWQHRVNGNIYIVHLIPNNAVELHERIFEADARANTSHTHSRTRHLFLACGHVTLWYSLVRIATYKCEYDAIAHHRMMDKFEAGRHHDHTRNV